VAAPEAWVLWSQQLPRTLERDSWCSFIHSTNMYWIPIAGDTMVNKTHIFSAFVELRVKWEHKDQHAIAMNLDRNY
jgi:hypothetical protein